MNCVLMACDRPFSYSAFDAVTPARFRNTTEDNLAKLKDRDTSTTETFRIAVLADAHYHFDDLEDALRDINSKKDISFIIVAGDLTENGLLEEFRLFHDIMSRSKIPYLTVIGNHDHLSNGELVYAEMYGPRNYSFLFNKVKFVMWDNVLWESNASPDWDWFRREVAIASDKDSDKQFNQIIPFSHIPPFDGQLADSATTLNELLVSNRIKASIHGHKHEYSNLPLFGDEVQYVTVGSPEKRAYALMTISADTVLIEQEKF
jgi:3',5'-cyclic-AMP phosphodiesterase